MDPYPRGPDWMPITPKTGSLFHAESHCGALAAPWVIDAPMDRTIFETYVRTQLVPTLQEGDIVILDNLPTHKSPAAEQAILDLPRICGERFQVYAACLSN